MGVKQVFEQLDAVCKPGAILASVRHRWIDAIAAFTKRPEDVVSLHFFSPACHAPAGSGTRREDQQ
ncbi:3-hydroxyacyl-CoA dehydrogenase NAD-binding domain-containing protein [Stutzerimonas xanthomarina]|uniref:3-hydroxyacyl-CoA dehydrogenase NAD-binding domain-containing protein n=1 Tax=Stutzerimonas xanthomarina TaxID=271420 RepID=UPI003AA816D8